MNDTKTIRLVGKLNNFCFYLTYHKKYKTYLKHHLQHFNPNDFYIYKATGKQRLVSVEDFLEFKYSGYILFHKDKYKTNNINIWLEWFDQLKILGDLKYLIKPFPKFDPYTKIIIKK